MQIFFIGNVLDTAKCLDKKRLHKQLIQLHGMSSLDN